MTADERLDEMKLVIDEMERELCNEINAEIFSYELKKQAIRDRYADLVRREEADNLTKRAHVDGLCKKAEALVNGIDRKIFKKQQKSITAAPDSSASDPDAVLGELLREVNSLEETVLPSGLRRLVDSVYFSINSKYKRASVDKILRLYETMQTLRSCNDLDAELSAKKAALSASEASELSVIDREISEMKEQRINSYVTALIQRATAS